MIEQTAGATQIGSGFARWKQEETRAASKKVEFGTWWRLNTSFWQVGWVEDTGELFAAERAPSDHFIVLSSLDKKEVTELMRKWFDGNSLEALLRRFAPAVLEEGTEDAVV